MMGVLIRGYLVSPKFSVPLSAKLCVGPTKVLELWECTRRALSHIHRCQVWWVSEFTRRRSGQNVEFLCVSVRHAFERQRLCARFRHEGVNDFDALVCNCAPVFNFIRLPAIGDTTKCRSPKNGKIWVLSLPEGDRTNRSRRNLARSVYTMGLL